MIETDGVSCSILLLRKDKVGKRVQQKKDGNREKYIDELKNKDHKKLKNKKIVAIDPFVYDII